MSEIGSGNGSQYPGTLSTNNTLEQNSPAAGKTKARAEVVNDLADCILKLEGELGVDPAGTLDTVKDFLQTEHGTDGTHAAVTATSVSTDTISEKTGAAGVTIDGCLIKDSGVTAVIDQGGGNNLRCKVVNIGDWDMNATGNVNIAHGIADSTKIRSIDALIRADDTVTLVNLLTINGSETSTHGISPNATNVVLFRGANGYFDNASYDSTSYNRGWITIWYTD